MNLATVPPKTAEDPWSLWYQGQDPYMDRGFADGSEAKSCLEWRVLSLARGIQSSGVPQGSVLGPLCFLVYVNDIVDVVSSSIKLYVDDANVYGCIDNQQQRQAMQNDLTAIEEWSKKWQLPFNIKKCSVIHLGSKNPECQYKLEGKTVHKTESESDSDLGIITDSEIKFHEHNASVMKKANSVRTH